MHGVGKKNCMGLSAPVPFEPFQKQRHGGNFCLSTIAAQNGRVASAIVKFYKSFAF